MAGSEEHLFRQFRLPWVPNWVPDWLEAMLRAPILWKSLGVTILTVVVSYLGWTFLEDRTGQESVDIAAWESRLSSATNAELPLHLDTLLQLQNDAAIALGIRQLTGSDPERRRLASLALQDAALQWSQWSPENASRQRERAVRLLAQVVSGLHAPEQVIAVELARQAMLQPPPLDTSLRDSLLSNSRILFAQAHPAHTGGLRWDDASQTDRPTDPARRSEFERPSSTSNWSTTFDANNPVASSTNPTFGEANPGDNGNSNRFRPVGFSRLQTSPSGNSGGQTNQSQRFDNGPQTSQIPLFDGEGRLIEVQSIDPIDHTTPGGLIPVGMSGSPRLPNSSSSLPEQRESGYRESAPAPGNLPNRIGGSRIHSPENIATIPLGQPIPGRTDSLALDAEARQRELASAFQLRAQSISATRQRTIDRIPANGVNSQIEPDTEIITSRPSTTPPPATPAPTTESPTAPPRLTEGTLRRSLPQNPYRGGGSLSSSDDPSAEPLPVEPSVNWRAMSHIEVMFRLRDEVPEIAEQATEELERRGFNSDYIAVARRLTSPDSRDRMQLVLDLVASQRVEPMPFLRWLANDPNPDVQSLAIDALEMLQASAQDRGADALSEPALRR